MSVNKAILVGRVGKDPDIKTVGSDQVANFSIATSEKYKNKQGEQVENTEWHNIVMWRKLAELAGKYVHKGDMLYIEGKIVTRNYDKDGQKHYTTEIVANEMRFLSSKSEQHTAPQQPAPQLLPSEAMVIEPDQTDLPF